MTETPAAALERALRDDPSAVVAAVTADGVLVGPPDSVTLHGQLAFAHGRGMDLFDRKDQVAVIDAWRRAADEGVVTLDVQLAVEGLPPGRLSFYDCRAEHGAYVVVLQTPDPEALRPAPDDRPAPPASVSRIERDGTAVILAVDAAFTAMLGWTPEEVVGRPSLDFIHPDDAEAAVATWLEMRGGAAPGRNRIRYRHRLGHHVWLEVTNDNHLHDAGIGRVFSELVDVSEEMRLLDALRQREQLLARLAEALPIGICHLHDDRDVVYANAPLTALLGPVATAADVLARVAPGDRALVAGAIHAAFDGVPGDLEVATAGDDPRRCELTLRPMTGETGEVEGVILCVADVTDRSRLRAELEHRADHDALSGCLNRAATLHALERALLTSSGVAVAFIDLDRFKAVNDEHGHAVGDQLLRATADRLRATVRAEDRVGRIGGDEFAVICPLRAGRDEGDLLRRVESAVNGTLQLGTRVLPLQASVGVATSRPGEVDAEAVLGRADGAMYDAKHRRSLLFGS